MVDVSRSEINGSCSKSESNIVFIEQFVQDVVGFSSQYGSDISISYTAYNITGKPSKFPDYGDFPQAFVMRTYGKWWNEAPSRTPPFMPQTLGKVISQDFIDLQFEESVYPFRVSVYETYHPGSVVRIWAADEGDHWRLLWEGEPQEVGHTPRVFSPVIRTISSPTKLLRLEFDHTRLEYYTELDAVLLTGTREPISGPEKQLYLNRVSNESAPVPGLGKLTSQILQLNIHNIPPQVDIPKSITSFIGEELPHLLKEAGDAELLKIPVKKTHQASKNESFNGLPDETILLIFGYLDLLSLCRCAQVCRRFYNLATDSLLYTELNFKEYWYCTDARALSSISKRCQYLQKLDLSWCGGNNNITSSDFVSFLEESGSLLTHLRLNSCKFADNLCAAKIAQICTSLKELGLRNCHGINESGFQALASLKNLEYLDLYRTLINLAPLKAILKTSVHLKHINMGSCVHISSMDDIAQTLAIHNKELVSVDFWKTYSLTPAGVRALRKCRKLQEVDLGWCLGVGAPGDSLHALAAGCLNLRKLFLAALRGITDRDLEPFIEHCPLLEQVDLLGVRSITSDICLKLLTKCRKLRLLDVSFCDQVQESEVAYWRIVFPDVSIKRSFQHDGAS